MSLNDHPREVCGGGGVEEREPHIHKHHNELIIKPVSQDLPWSPIWITTVAWKIDWGLEILVCFIIL